MSRVSAGSMRAAAALVGVIAIGLVLRGFIMRSALGELNADEAYAALQSIGVIRDRRFPIVIDGQVYSAAIDAYLLSPIANAAGGSIAILKWAYVGLWAAAAVATFGATRRLVDRRTAAVAGGLVWLTPGALLVFSTRLEMGYPLGLAAVACTIWATAVVADQATAGPRQSALVGFLAGLGFYIHPMLATVLVPIVIVAAVVHRRDWKHWWLPAVGAAIAANSLFLAWNATNGWPSLQPQYYPPGSYLDRFTGFFTGLLPRALGLLTFDGRWVFAKPIAVLLYIAILIGVLVGSIVLLKAHRRPSRWIVPVGLLACFPLMALLPHLIFVTDGRYAIIPLPLMAIALGAAATHFIRNWSTQRAMGALAAVVVLWVAVTAVPFLGRQDGFTSTDANAWQERVITRLDELGIDRLAGNYWLVLPIEFRSDRSIRVAVAGHPYVIRFQASQRIVQNSDHDRVAFLFYPGEQDPNLFYLPPGSYRSEDLGGIILYVPLAMGE